MIDLDLILDPDLLMPCALNRIISSHFGDDRFVMGLRQIYSVSSGDSDREEALITIMATRIYSVCDLRRTVREKDQARGVKTAFLTTSSDK